MATQAPDGLRNAGPEPQRFTVSDGQLQNIASAAWPAAVRLGAGGFASGYTPGAGRPHHPMGGMRGQLLAARCPCPACWGGPAQTLRMSSHRWARRRLAQLRLGRGMT